jgi:hypothetical protein
MIVSWLSSSDVASTVGIYWDTVEGNVKVKLLFTSCHNQRVSMEEKVNNTVRKCLILHLSHYHM